MSKSFMGKPITGGNISANAVVSRKEPDLSLTFNSNAIQKGSLLVGADQGNHDLYHKEITGKVLCLPKVKTSEIGSLLLHTICKKGTAPAAILFAEQIDSDTAAGIVTGSVWTGNTIIAVSGLGKEFLEYVKDNMTVEIKENGEVIIS